jgi:hypothetical protein
MVGKFLASAPGSALRVFIAAVLGLFVTWLANGNTFDDLDWTTVQTWIGVAITVALPIIIAWINPQDPRFGKTS